MLMLISPAKNLNERDVAPTTQYTQPDLLQESSLLMQDVRSLAPQDIANLMHVSDKIAVLNYERNNVWHTPFTLDNAKQAVFMFNGDVYEGLDAKNLNADGIAYLQNHLRILSGLYGLLRPLDLMQAYRLEMGTPLVNSRGKNLYDFWGDKITQLIEKTLKEQQYTTVINLASQEYYKSVQEKQLNARVITPIFKDQKNGQYKIISFYAKRARGLMVRYAADYRIQDPEQLKNFDYEGYVFHPASSSETEWVFLRDEQVK